MDGMGALLGSFSTSFFDLGRNSTQIRSHLPSFFRRDQKLRQVGALRMQGIGMGWMEHLCMGYISFVFLPFPQKAFSHYIISTKSHHISSYSYFTKASERSEAKRVSKHELVLFSISFGGKGGKDNRDPSSSFS